MLAEEWNGKKWVLLAPVEPAGATAGSLRAVSCVSASDCMAVGEYEHADVVVEGEPTLSAAVAESWNGSSWTLHATPAIAKAWHATLEGVSCTSADACFAVGSTRTGVGNRPSLLAEGWNGSEWATETTKTPTPHGGFAGNYFTSVSCASSTTCTATGEHYEYAEGVGFRWATIGEHWNGSEWTELATPGIASSEPNPRALADVSCISTAACTAVGEYSEEDGGTDTLAEAFGPPLVKEEPATGITSTSATLNATVDPDGWETTYHFEYGPSEAYGTTVPIPDEPLKSEATPERTSRTITGLTAGATYHYRLVATSGAAVTDGHGEALKTP
jgi:hypothetical protein